MKIKSRVQLRKSAKNQLLSDIRSVFGDDVKQLEKSKFETANIDDMSLILVDGEPLLFQINGFYFPTVKGALKLDLKKNVVTVDSGAVRFVVNGADIMCPGIVAADDNIMEDDPVIIIEEAHGKPLAVGTALMPGSEMKGNKGKGVKSIHYVGDKLWNLDI
ncbi:RNA-binding protein [Methanolobus bombayensis]|uniref:RNA-binding protein n=1 Tax=Methanolobus bombayensis TaxID=38023 RepID=UPI001AE46A6D|nr:RNA-binding protein [Methanolobus bombayensis]MBP1908800.1 PUA domain protein [Methanolobus bombayensis]